MTCKIMFQFYLNILDYLSFKFWIMREVRLD